MKQTAVEWLEDCFKRYGTLLKSDFIKAKEMEKQQIIDAANLDKRHYDNAEQYYNETFNKREIPNIKNEFLAKIK